MKNDSQCPLMGEQSQCSVLSLLQEILEEIKLLHQNLKRKRKTNRKKTKDLSQLNVNDGIKMLTLDNPKKVWTSVELAKELGCTDAAVRKTDYWKTYQKILKGNTPPHSLRNGCINNGGLDAIYEDDIEAMDEEIDKTTE